MYCLKPKTIAEEILPFCTGMLYHEVNYYKLCAMLAVWSGDKRYKPKMLQANQQTLVFIYGGIRYSFQWDFEDDRWVQI